MATISVSVPDDLAAQIDQRVAAGEYPSANEVAVAAIRLLFDREAHLDFLRSEIDVAAKQFASGEFRSLSPELLGEIKAAGRARKGNS